MAVESEAPQRLTVAAAEKAAAADAARPGCCAMTADWVSPGTPQLGLRVCIYVITVSFVACVASHESWHMWAIRVRRRRRVKSRLGRPHVP